MSQLSDNLWHINKLKFLSSEEEFNKMLDKISPIYMNDFMNLTCEGLESPEHFTRQLMGDYGIQELEYTKEEADETIERLDNSEKKSIMNYLMDEFGDEYAEQERDILNQIYSGLDDKIDSSGYSTLSIIETAWYESIKKLKEEKEF